MTRARSHHSSPSGFTLIEVMIAVVAIAIVLAAINAVFYGAVRLRNKTVAAIDEALPLEHALTVIRRDLANLVAPGGTLSGTLQTTKVTTQNSSSSSSSGSSSSSSSSSSASSAPATANQPPPGVVGQSSPEFYTATGVVDETTPFAEVQKVVYFLANSTNGNYGKDLVRSASRNLLSTVSDQPFQTYLLTGVESITFQFHDGTQWLDTWDSTSTLNAPLPRAIKMQIALATLMQSRQKTPPVEVLVPLLIEAPTNSTSQASSGGTSQ